MSYPPPSQPGSHSNRHSMPAQSPHHRHPHSHPSDPPPRQPYPNANPPGAPPPHHQHHSHHQHHPHHGHQRGASYPPPATQFQPQSQPVPQTPQRGSGGGGGGGGGSGMNDTAPPSSFARRPPPPAATTYLTNPTLSGPIMSTFFAPSPQSRGFELPFATAYALRAYLEVFLYYLGYDPSTGSTPQTFIELKESKLARELGLQPEKARALCNAIYESTTPNMEKVCLGIIGMEEKLGCTEEMSRAVRFLFRRNHGMTPEEMLAGGGKVVGVYGETVLEEMVLPGLIRERKKNGGLGPSGAADSGGGGDGGAWKKIWKKGWKFGGRKEGEGGEGPLSPTGQVPGPQGLGITADDSPVERDVGGEEAYIDQGPQAAPPPQLMMGANGTPGVTKNPQLQPQQTADYSPPLAQPLLSDNRESRDIEGRPQRTKSQRQSQRLKPLIQPQQLQPQTPLDSPLTILDPELTPTTQAVDPLASISSRAHHYRRRSEAVDANSSPLKQHSSMRKHREKRERSGSVSTAQDGGAGGGMGTSMTAAAVAGVGAGVGAAMYNHHQQHHHHHHEQKQTGEGSGSGSGSGGGVGVGALEDPFRDRPAPEDIGEARIKSDSKKRRRERRESRQPIDSREREVERPKDREREGDIPRMAVDRDRGADPQGWIMAQHEWEYHEQLQREQMQREQLLREQHVLLKQHLQPVPQPHRDVDGMDRELERDIPAESLRHTETDPVAQPLPELVMGSRPQTGNINAPLPPPQPPMGSSNRPSSSYMNTPPQQQPNGSNINIAPIPMPDMPPDPEDDPFIDQADGQMALPLPPLPLFHGSNSRPGSRNGIAGSELNLPLPPSTSDLRPGSGRSGGVGSVGRGDGRESGSGSGSVRAGAEYSSRPGTPRGGGDYPSRPGTGRDGGEYSSRPGTARGIDRVNTAVANGHVEGIGDSGVVAVGEGMSPPPAYIHPDDERRGQAMGLRTQYLQPPQTHQLSQPPSLEDMRAMGMGVGTGMGMGMREGGERMNQHHPHPNHHQRHHHHEHRHHDNHLHEQTPEPEQDPQEIDSITGGNTEVSSHPRRRTKEREHDRDQDRSHTRDKDKDKDREKKKRSSKEKEKDRESSSRHKHKHKERDGAVTDVEKDQKRRKDRDERKEKDKDRSVRSKDADRRSRRPLPGFGNGGVPGPSGPPAVGYDPGMNIPPQGQPAYQQLQDSYAITTPAPPQGAPVQGGLTSVENTPPREHRHKRDRDRSSHTRHREKSRARERERDRSQAPPGEGMTTGGEDAERAERKERRRKEKKQKDKRREKERSSGGGGGEGAAGESASVSNTGGETLRRRKKERERVDRDRERERMEREVHAQGGIVV